MLDNCSLPAIIHVHRHISQHVNDIKMLGALLRIQHRELKANPYICEANIYVCCLCVLFDVGGIAGVVVIV